VIDKPAIDGALAIRLAIKEKGWVFVVAHSQGSAIFKQSLSLLTKEERSHIHYLGIGPEWNIDAKREGLASALNIWNKGDIVPHLGNQLKIISNTLLPWNWGRESNVNTEITKTNSNGSGSPHRFSNYEKSATEWAQKWRGIWNLDELQLAR
jgi:hypothetical protein